MSELDEQESATPQPESVGGTIVFLLIAFFVVAALIVWACFKFTNWSDVQTSLRDFAALTAVGLSALGALTGLVVSLLTLRRNQQAAIQLAEKNNTLQSSLETVKSELQVKLEGVKKDLQSQLMDKQMWTNLRLEYERSKSADETSAYAMLWKSVDAAYQGLAKLETGSWANGDRVQMENVLQHAAEGLPYLRDQEHRVLWERARQRARYIAEQAENIGTTQQPKLWRENVSGLAEICSQVKHLADEEIRRLPPS
jgi:flagellar basal body-associated protein FliL